MWEEGRHEALLEQIAREIAEAGDVTTGAESNSA
jgi:hypothetical protein